MTDERLAGKEKGKDYREVTLKVHQFDNFCRRVLSKKNEPVQRAALFWAFLSLMTHGQRELYHLNKYLDKAKSGAVKTPLLKDMKKMLDLLQDGFVKNDASKLGNVHDMEKKLIYGKFYDAVSNGKLGIVQHHLASAIRTFYLASSPLIGILIAPENA